jgi:predicted O-linked N-acetylglucosamine transferase (SPINDLY family)
VRIVPGTPAHAEHLAEYHDVDLALDTFPYTGTTTTCEALSMGVPVITRAGDRHAARVGASLLAALDLRELIAANENQYVEIARSLASNRAALATLRATLPERLASSTLCDAPAFARRFERALLSLNAKQPLRVSP